MAPIYDMNSCFQAFHAGVSWHDVILYMHLIIFILDSAGDDALHQRCFHSDIT